MEYLENGPTIRIAHDHVVLESKIAEENVTAQVLQIAVQIVLVTN